MYYTHYAARVSTSVQWSDGHTSEALLSLSDTAVRNCVLSQLILCTGEYVID